MLIAKPYNRKKKKNKDILKPLMMYIIIPKKIVFN